jgi:hypothetical protein
MMNDIHILKSSIKKIKKLQVGSIVSVEAYGEIQYFTVAEIVPCKWQGGYKKRNDKDICYYCPGNIRLNTEKYATCKCFDDGLEFDFVQEPMIKENEFMV